MNRPPSRLRNRLLVAMVAVSFGVLVLSLLGARPPRRARARRTPRSKDLKEQAPAVAAELDSFGKQFRNGTLSPADGAGTRHPDPPARRASSRSRTAASSTVQPDGTIVEGATGLLGLAANPAAQVAAAARSTLPDGVTQSDLDAQKLLAGSSRAVRTATPCSSPGR